LGIEGNQPVKLKKFPGHWTGSTGCRKAAPLEVKVGNIKKMHTAKTWAFPFLGTNRKQLRERPRVNSHVGWTQEPR